MKSRRKKILFVLPSLTGGGAERVMTTIITHLDRKRFEPVLVLLQKEGPFLSKIPEEIRILDLQAARARYAIFKIIAAIKRERPDVVFSTLGHLNLLMAMLKPLFLHHIAFIARESNTVSIENAQEKYPGLFNWLYRRLYPRFDRIVAQSRSMKEDLVVNYGIDSGKIEVIYNPVDARGILSELDSTVFYRKEKRKDKSCRLLAVGRLSRQKGFDLLIEAVAKLPDTYSLKILGEGESKEVLQRQIEALGLAQRVELAGFSDAPYCEMRQVDLLVLSSRYEGLPNVVLEANVCALPVVSFDSPGGTAELIREGENGFLVEAFDIDALAKTIEKACGTSFEREKISKEAIRLYDVGKIVKAYEALLEKACIGC
ncbi:MAG: hypothetical protein B6D59_06490 [Campylobacteraceae bacterium 4484_4]|nr:MAG: hypothetical protein B6D59_06490 [Campylobacteraceae bacterium 4484_4]